MVIGKEYEGSVDFYCTTHSSMVGSFKYSLGECSNECALNLDNCHANATCTDTSTSFDCTCNSDSKAMASRAPMWMSAHQTHAILMQIVRIQ